MVVPVHINERYLGFIVGVSGLKLVEHPRLSLARAAPVGLEVEEDHFALGEMLLGQPVCISDRCGQRKAGCCEGGKACKAESASVHFGSPKGQIDTEKSTSQAGRTPKSHASTM